MKATSENLPIFNLQMTFLVFSTEMKHRSSNRKSLREKKSKKKNQSLKLRKKKRMRKRRTRRRKRSLRRIQMKIPQGSRKR